MTPESESGAAQRQKVTTGLEPSQEEELLRKLHLAWVGYENMTPSRWRDDCALIAQHTRAEVRKAVEPLISALEKISKETYTVVDEGDGESALSCIPTFEKKPTAGSRIAKSALSAHRARESQEGPRGSSGVSPSTELKP